ncbi:Rrf2 family transcriptional regulator [Halorarum halophilum]|uniref:Rrf2 family transcriptional regulator n=1 Tax=Halorarum halophilum TaxID=2743090 RepID=A0A7D5GZ55_9EURY|nr:HTH domain-containing protein [Halobaculum halophilum]QLG29249.1 Rrf2 family transcriptional regulator [Halobaculum halophilum]
MSQIELNDVQNRILAILVEEYQSRESPVKGEFVADEVGRSAGSIRNQFQSLKALGLVEGIPGPKGGYKPTASAFNVLDYQNLDDPERLIVAHDYERVTATVDQIDLLTVREPEQCQARVHFQEPIEGFGVGDPIVVGPTPISELVLVGEIEEIDGTTNHVVLDVSSMEAPFSEE